MTCVQGTELRQISDYEFEMNGTSQNFHKLNDNKFKFLIHPSQISQIFRK